MVVISAYNPLKTPVNQGVSEIIIEFLTNHNDPADREDSYSHPILCPSNRNTEARVMDMVCYLTGKVECPKLLRKILRTTIPYNLVFNYWLDEYVRDYLTEPLWKIFFRGQEELLRIIAQRGISSFDILVYRAMDYFDRYEKEEE